MKIKVKHLSSIWQKTIGLIGCKTAYPVYFQTRFGIHTFGLRFPIDVLILDEVYRVVKIKNIILPNRLFLWNPKYYNVVELPAGEIEKKGIKLNSKIRIVPSSWRERSDR